MLEKLYKIKWFIEDTINSEILTIKINILIRKIESEKVTIEEVAKYLSEYNKNLREELINTYQYKDTLIYETLKKANQQLETIRKEEFINSVKTNTYKEYLNTLTTQQIYDLIEYFYHELNVIALYSKEKQEEYSYYIDILSEKISILTNSEIIDFDLIEELFKTLEIEEIAKYIKTYPDIFLMMDPKDKEVERKMEEAATLVQNKMLDIEEIESQALIYKKRKYF